MTTLTIDADAFAEAIARRVAELLREDDQYDQDHLPTGLTRRVYLDAARRGAFPATKVGRKVVAKRSDVDTWMQSKPVRSRPRRASIAQDEIDAIVRMNGASRR